MSKKTKKAKQLRREQIHSQLLAPHISHAQHQMLQGDFTGAIDTCTPLLGYLPKQSSKRAEVLGLLGLAHGMLQHYEESYNLFTEALTLDPTNADLWYNHGLACEFTTRIGQAMHSFEHAVEFLGTDSGEVAHKFAHALEMSRKEVENAMQMYGDGATLAQDLEQEKCFMHGMSMTRQSKWEEAEQAFRQLIDMGGRLPQYWGNLAASLVMQLRYDEAEVALKHALEIDPSYTFARSNLAKLPEVRRAGGPLGMEVKDLSHDVIQSLTFYKQSDDNGSLTPHATVEKNENIIRGTRAQVGKQQPRHHYFLNPHKGTRFMTCPQCGNKTRPRKFCLVIHIQPAHSMVLEKICRYCYHCDLIIVHQDQLEERLTAFFTKFKPEVVGNDYVVMGTLNLGELKHEIQNGLPTQEMIEHLQDFKEVLSFEFSNV
ncbi:MAG: hypothetical protein NVS9B9_18750 [Ktedonobacteraceae bacterium]